MSYKIFACDLDGTLLDDNSNVSKDNFDAIEQMTKDGIEFALCTGRTFYEIPQSLRDFQSIRYIIYSDGSVIFDKKKNKNVYEHYIDMQTLIRLYNLLSSYDTMIEFYENKEPKTDKSKLNINSYHYYKIDENYIDVIDKTRIGIEDLSSAVDLFDKTELLNVFFKNLDERKNCFEKLKHFDNIIFTTSMTNNIEITAENISKGSALSKLGELIGAKSNEIIAAGDSKNDLPMFEFAGLPIAAGNASDEIKSITKNTACSNNESIVKYIYDKYIK